MSVAASPDTGTVSEVAVAGRVKAPTVGAATSGRVMVTVAVRADETLPAASLAQAYAVLAPSPEKVKLAGAVADQPVALAAGAVALSVIR